MDKTKLPGETYEKWLRTNKERSSKTRGSQTPVLDSYEAWIEKRVQSKLKAAKTT